MAYQMARLPMTLSELEGHFCSLLSDSLIFSSVISNFHCYNHVCFGYAAPSVWTRIPLESCDEHSVCIWVLNMLTGRQRMAAATSEAGREWLIHLYHSMLSKYVHSSFTLLSYHILLDVNFMA